jgi:hypothetical protein
MVRLVPLTTVLPTNVEVRKPVVSDTGSIFNKVLLSITWGRSVNTPSDLAGGGSETTQSLTGNDIAMTGRLAWQAAFQFGRLSTVVRHAPEISKA